MAVPRARLPAGDERARVRVQHPVPAGALRRRSGESSHDCGAGPTTHRPVREDLAAPEVGMVAASLRRIHREEGDPPPLEVASVLEFVRQFEPPPGLGEAGPVAAGTPRDRDPLGPRRSRRVPHAPGGQPADAARPRAGAACPGRRSREPAPWCSRFPVPRRCRKRSASSNWTAAAISAAPPWPSPAAIAGVGPGTSARSRTATRRGSSRFASTDRDLLMDSRHLTGQFTHLVYPFRHALDGRDRADRLAALPGFWRTWWYRFPEPSQLARRWIPPASSCPTCAGCSSRTPGCGSRIAACGPRSRDPGPDSRQPRAAERRRARDGGPEPGSRDRGGRGAPAHRRFGRGGGPGRSSSSARAKRGASRSRSVSPTRSSSRRESGSWSSK